MEFLVDRFGYLVGRWISEGIGEEWSDVDFLMNQINEFNREEEISHLPGDHIH